MIPEIHNHSILVNQDEKRDTSAQMENRVKSKPLGIRKMEILDPKGNGVDIIGLVIQIEIDDSERLP